LEPEEAREEEILKQEVLEPEILEIFQKPKCMMQSAINAKKNAELSLNLAQTSQSYAMIVLGTKEVYLSVLEKV